MSRAPGKKKAARFGAASFLRKEPLFARFAGRFRRRFARRLHIGFFNGGFGLGFGFCHMGLHKTG